jgi:hypothetical protein
MSAYAFYRAKSASKILKITACQAERVNPFFADRKLKASAQNALPIPP